MRELTERFITRAVRLKKLVAENNKNVNIKIDKINDIIKRYYE